MHRTTIQLNANTRRTTPKMYKWIPNNFSNEQKAITNNHTPKSYILCNICIKHILSALHRTYIYIAGLFKALRVYQTELVRLSYTKCNHTTLDCSFQLHM